MEMRVLAGEVVPSMVMVTMEFFTISLTILGSTVISRGGLNPFLFVLYTNAFGSLFLILYCLFFDKHKAEEKSGGLTFQVWIRIFFLGLIGISITQNLAYVGLSYSSPIVACGMGNLIPAFSFVLSLFLRRKIEWKRSGNQVKLVGTLISMAGAISLTLYRGPVVNKNSPFSPASNFLRQRQRQRQQLFVFLSTHENWILGCILYAAASFSLSAWNIIQVGTIKKYPQVMKIICLYSLIGTILSAIPAAFFIPPTSSSSSWRLYLDFNFLVILLTAIFGSIIKIRVNIWCTNLKGSVFGAIFKPVGIPIASMFGCFLFSTTFHYGSMMGAIICGLGYYTLIWGQIAHDDEQVDCKGSKDNNALPRVPDEKVPLLGKRSVEDSPV